MNKSCPAHQAILPNFVTNRDVLFFCHADFSRWLIRDKQKLTT